MRSSTSDQLWSLTAGASSQACASPVKATVDVAGLDIGNQNQKRRERRALTSSLKCKALHRTLDCCSFRHRSGRCRFGPAGPALRGWPAGPPGRLAVEVTRLVMNCQGLYQNRAGSVVSALRARRVHWHRIRRVSRGSMISSISKNSALRNGERRRLRRSLIRLRCAS